MSLLNQTIAQRLAVCNDIGEAAYLPSLVGAAMLDSLTQHPTAHIIAGAVTVTLQHCYNRDPVCVVLVASFRNLITSNSRTCANFHELDA